MLKKRTSKNSAEKSKTINFNFSLFAILGIGGVFFMV